MNKFLALVLCLVMAAVVGLQYYQLRSNEQFQRDVAQELALIKAELELQREENTRINRELQDLRQSDIDVLVEDAGQALVSGWNSMLEALETELRKAEKSLRERSGKPPAEPESNPSEGADGNG